MRFRFKPLPPDPRFLYLVVGICLVCVFVGDLVRLLLEQERYITAAGVVGGVVGLLVYFDGLRRAPRGGA
jgi:hypothetical protein